MNIDYVVVKNKPDFIFGQKKESKTYKWRSLLRNSFCQLPIMGKLTRLVLNNDMPETGRSSLGDTDHYPAVIQDAFRKDREDSAAGRLQTDRLVLRTGGHHFRHRAFPAAQGRALAA